MSPGRFVLAGLVAGITNLVLGFGFAHLFGVEKLQAILRQHGLRAIGEPGDAIPHTLVRLLTGIAVTALVVAVGPRFGPGLRSALVAAVFAWAFVPVFTAWGYAHIGLFTKGQALALAAWGAIEMAGTACVGAWILGGRGFWSS